MATIQQLIQQYRQNPSSFTDDQIQEIAALAYRSKIPFEAETSGTRLAKNFAFHALDSALLGLIPDRFAPNAFTEAEDWGGKIGTGLGFLAPTGFLKVGKTALSGLKALQGGREAGLASSALGRLGSKAASQLKGFGMQGRVLEKLTGSEAKKAFVAKYARANSGKVRQSAINKWAEQNKDTINAAWDEYVAGLGDRVSQIAARAQSMAGARGGARLGGFAAEKLQNIANNKYGAGAIQGAIGAGMLGAGYGAGTNFSNALGGGDILGAAIAPIPGAIGGALQFGAYGALGGGLLHKMLPKTNIQTPEVGGSMGIASGTGVG